MSLCTLLPRRAPEKKRGVFLHACRDLADEGFDCHWKEESVYIEKMNFSLGEDTIIYLLPIILLYLLL